MNFEEAVKILQGANLSIEAKDAIGVIIDGAKHNQCFTDDEKESVLKILDLEAKLLGIQADALEAVAVEYEQLAEQISDSAEQMILDLDAFVDELKKDTGTQ